MIEPYNAVGLIPSFWGIRRREDMAKNLEHIESLTHASFWRAPQLPLAFDREEPFARLCSGRGAGR